MAVLSPCRARPTLTSSWGSVARAPWAVLWWVSSPCPACDVAHGSCCLASNQVKTMWFFCSSFCLSCSSPTNTLFFAIPIPPLNYGAAKDLSQGMAGDGALSRAGWLLWVRARGLAPLPEHCLSGSGSKERSAGKVPHEVPRTKALVSPATNPVPSACAAMVSASCCGVLCKELVTGQEPSWCAGGEDEVRKQRSGCLCMG